MQYIQFLKDISPQEGSTTFVHCNYSLHRAAAVKTWLSSQTLLKRMPWPSHLEHLLPFREIWRSLLLELNFQSVMNPSESTELNWNDISECFETLSANSFIENAVTHIPWSLMRHLNSEK